MMRPVCFIPNEVSGNSALLSNLNSYLGKSVEQICPKYGLVDDAENHCAHFVGHVLQLRLPGAALCSNVAGTKNTYAERHQGYCIRVNQVFNSCSGKGKWDAKTAPSTPCLIVATVSANIVSKTTWTIGSMRDKHIGIYNAGSVYNYSNSRDKVVATPIGEFATHYGKSKTILLKANMP